jgi:hypothetical protein
VPPIVHEVLHSPGQQLDPAAQAFFEPRFGQDFSRVRVHTDAKATESTRAVNAKAYTVGNHVAFAVDQYRLQSTEGQRRLAHELAHVVQQGDLSTDVLVGINPPSSTSEGEARAAADVVVRGDGIPSLSQLSTRSLSRDEEQTANGGEIRASAWGLSSDTEIRDWVRRENLTAIGQISLKEKLRLINRLLDGWVSDEDLDAIDKVCRSVTSAQEMAVIRAVISLRAIDLTDLGQRTRLRVILIRTPQVAAPPQAVPPAPTPSATKEPSDPSQPSGAPSSEKLEFYHGTRWSIAKKIPKNVQPLGGGDFAAGFYTHHDDNNKKALKRAIDWGKLMANRPPSEPYAGVVNFRVPETEYRKLLVNSKEFNLRYLDQPDYKERQKEWFDFVTSHGRVAEPTFHADRGQWIHERKEPQPHLPYNINIVKGPFYTPLRGTEDREPKPEEFAPYALGKKVPYQVTWANEGIKLLNSDRVDTELMQYDTKTGKRQDPPIETVASEAAVTPAELAKAAEEAQFAMTK